MSNELFFKNIQNNYESLKYFIVKDNMLYFKDNDNKMYSLPLTFNLAEVNNNLFLLKPRDIYRVLYLLELLSHNELNNNDAEFIKQYTEKYIKLEQERLENNSVSELETLCLGIPIYESYNPIYMEKPASILMQNILNNQTEKIENGKSHGKKLVLVNPNFPKVENDENSLEDLGKAGFTAIMLVVLTVILTSLYIAFFIIK